ncbi:MAG: ATP-binding protein [Zoogloea sp.]|uniref:response regulator n=1 Tax=Zoogloea sp. TaxID=49181 RepID=UPI00262A7B2F|nr:response regulator [Zoogloea sp.]MDD3327207.1 ATP-binding protein [Zoogloea sp.]
MPAQNLISIETETRRQMFLLLCQNSLSSVALNLLVCSGLAIVALQTWPGGILHPLVWLAGVGMTTVPFLFMGRRVVHDPGRLEDDAVLRQAERTMIWSTIVMAGGWVVAIVAYSLPCGLEFRLLLTALIAGMGAGAVPKLLGASPYMEIFIGMIAATFFPVCIIAGTLTDYVIAGGALIYVYAVMESARRLNSALRSSITFSLERLSLLASTREALSSAEKASKVKGEFLATMSHEIRTPIHAILGIAQVMLRSDLSPGHARQLGRIDVAAEHLLGVINDILDLSKIEAGKMLLDSGEVNVDEIIERVLALVSREAASKGLALQVDCAPIPRQLLGDSVRLTQALLNYVNNAVKFTAKGGVTIRVRRKAEVERRILLHFEVEDSGVGIAPEQFARLFSAFEQADASTTREYGGSGLGLTITRHLVQLMGGEAGGHSEPGVGSTFWFSVWLDKPRAAAGCVEPDPASLDAAEAALRRDHAGQRVLVADDDEGNCELAREIFALIGLMMERARTGEEAVEMAQATAYDLILMDMRMPRMDGLEATRQIRRLPGRAQTPILAMTGNAFREDREKCLASEMNDFIPKPVRLEVLYAKLLEWLPAPPKPGGTAGPGA